MDKRRFHIILIDDYRNGMETLADLLQCWGYTVTPVSSGRAALQLLNEGAYDLVITNLTELPRFDALCSVRDIIPDMTNLDVLIKVQGINPELPVIVFAPYGSNGAGAKAVRQGAADYIRKPFSLEELKARIEKVLQTNVRRIPRDPVLQA